MIRNLSKLGRTPLGTPVQAAFSKKLGIGEATVALESKIKDIS